MRANVVAPSSGEVDRQSWNWLMHEEQRTADIAPSFLKRERAPGLYPGVISFLFVSACLTSNFFHNCFGDDGECHIDFLVFVHLY